MMQIKQKALSRLVGPLKTTTRAEGKTFVKPFDSLRLLVPMTSQTIAAIIVSRALMFVPKRLDQTSTRMSSCTFWREHIFLGRILRPSTSKNI